MVGADQVLGGKQLHRPAGDQRLADGVCPDPGLGPVRAFGELQPVRPPEYPGAAQPSQDLAVGVCQYQEVPAGTGIGGQQVVQRRHDPLKPVLPPQLQDAGDVVQVPRTVLVRADPQGHGAPPRIRQVVGDLRARDAGDDPFMGAAQGPRVLRRVRKPRP